MLADGIARGSFRPVDVHVASLAITGMILAAHRGRSAGGPGKKSAEDLSPIKELVFEGLASTGSAPDDDSASRLSGVRTPRSNFK